MNALALAAQLDYDPDFQRAVELIGKRWTGSIIRALLAGPQRFNVLLLGIPDISDRVLTERLRELERVGLLERLVDPGPPLSVSYRLTHPGRRLSAAFACIDVWARSEWRVSA